MKKALFLGVLLCVAGLLAGEDWTTFGWDGARTSAPSVSMGITAANLGSLQRQQVLIDGTADSSAIYLKGAMIGGSRHDAFFLTTTYGKTIAIDADSGRVLWEYTPSSYASVAGSYQITTATPVADPDRRYIYAASPDGVIRKLSVSSGRAVWATAITRLPEREKIASPLGYSNGRVIAATDGYIGDQPPYQGHVVLIDARSGALLSVWNSLCSDRHELMDPSSCPSSDSGIWGRAGVVVDPSSGNLFIATGNAPWDGRTNWGDSVIELDANATHILGNYTPSNTEELNVRDADLGSTSPALLGGGLIAQGGKDGWIRLLDWQSMKGTSPHRGGAATRIPTPASQRLFSAPAVWHNAGSTWLFVANYGATTAYRLLGKQLAEVWSARTAGTSPVVVDDLLFVYDPYGGLRVYRPTDGKLLTTLRCGGGHWNSPIVVDGKIALPEGNANHRLTAGLFDIWRLP